MQLIDGKAVADRIKQEIAQEVEYICSTGGKRPHLAAVLVGHDGGSDAQSKSLRTMRVQIDSRSL